MRIVGTSKRPIGGASVREGHIPVLWITGPSGVGKSTVSWQIFTEIAQAGVGVAFADADQFCMCYPAPPGDPTRERIKARNIGALVPRYCLAGAHCVIVNGCLDPQGGLYSELMPQAAVTVCRLRADLAEVARRFIGRQGAVDGLEDLVKETLDEAAAMDASSFADVCVDTTGVTVAEVTGLVRDSCRDWPGFSGAFSNARDAGGKGDDLEASANAQRADGKILLICGPTGVGKSTVGFDLFLRHLRAGRTAGYVDLDQIGFVRPGSDNDPGGHRLKAANLAAMWRTYHAAGATHLVATGPVDGESALQTYLRALPAGVTVCRLHAGPAELTRRIISRAEGGSWNQPGDPLRGQSAEYLLRVADQAIAGADALEGAVRIDTDQLTAAEAADLIAVMTTG